MTIRDIRFESEIRGIALGNWSYGRIGRETARLVKAFGLRIHALVRDRVRPRRRSA